ncbi:MAG TPA: DUF2914 domain-containing protein [Longimicrobium sp.]|nr:DUF2914 domain-containing protein [Longimicrobium sp.]
MSEAVTDRSHDAFSALLTRRAFLGALPGAGILLAGGSVACAPAERSFFVRHVLDFEPAEIFKGLAIHIIDGQLDFVDAYCAHCRTAIRLFLAGADIYTVMTLACPECGVSVRLATAGARMLLEKLAELGFDRAVALATAGRSDDEYRVHPEGPLDGPRGRIFVARSALCDDIRGHEPVDLFNRAIPFVPERLVFFTDVQGLSDPTKIHHVWRVEGEVTDRIPLQICYGECGSRFRTYSRKHNLRPGPWIITAEDRHGNVLASRGIVLGG